jgi:hypothetical protein
MARLASSEVSIARRARRVSRVIVMANSSAADTAKQRT